MQLRESQPIKANNKVPRNARKTGGIAARFLGKLIAYFQGLSKPTEPFSSFWHTISICS